MIRREAVEELAAMEADQQAHGVCHAPRPKLSWGTVNTGST